MTHCIDHLVYATPDLEDTVQQLAHALGVRPQPGGQHQGWGTHNYLASLGEGVYLEIVGPDARQAPPCGPRPFGIDELRGPSLVTWALTVPNMVEAIRAARAAEYDPGAATSMSRMAADGSVLSWQLTTPPLGDDGGIVPFLIDWDATTHPSTTSVQGLSLRSMRAEHPTPRLIDASLRALRAPLAVTSGLAAGLIAVIQGPAGEVALHR